LLSYKANALAISKPTKKEIDKINEQSYKLNIMQKFGKEEAYEALSQDLILNLIC